MRRLGEADDREGDRGSDAGGGGVRGPRTGWNLDEQTHLDEATRADADRPGRVAIKVLTDGTLAMYYPGAHIATDCVSEPYCEQSRRSRVAPGN